MASDHVFVEILDSLDVIRIFDNQRAAVVSPAWQAGLVRMLPYPIAVEIIRRAVFSRDNWCCTHCGDPFVWVTGHMHERLWRGRGGEISLDNSVSLCGMCHLTNPVAGHGERAVQWSR